MHGYQIMVEQTGKIVKDLAEYRERLGGGGFKRILQGESLRPSKW